MENDIIETRLCSQRLPEEFYDRNSVDVAKDLLGKYFVCNKMQGVITETEAYRGKDDEASHAFNGPTARTQIMFGPPGYSYIYMIYGIYYCFNVVTESDGMPGAVLLRGILTSNLNLNGPGKICRHFKLTKDYTGMNLVKSTELYLCYSPITEPYFATKRIGIKKGTDKLWRFVMSKQSL